MDAVRFNPNKCRRHIATSSDRARPRALNQQNIARMFADNPIRMWSNCSADDTSHADVDYTIHDCSLYWYIVMTAQRVGFDGDVQRFSYQPDTDSVEHVCSGYIWCNDVTFIFTCHARIRVKLQHVQRSYDCTYHTVVGTDISVIHTWARTRIGLGHCNYFRTSRTVNTTGNRPEDVREYNIVHTHSILWMEHRAPVKNPINTTWHTRCSCLLKWLRWIRALVQHCLLLLLCDVCVVRFGASRREWNDVCGGVMVVLCVGLCCDGFWCGSQCRICS